MEMASATVQPVLEVGIEAEETASVMLDVMHGTSKFSENTSNGPCTAARLSVSPDTGAQQHDPPPPDSENASNEDLATSYKKNKRVYFPDDGRIVSGYMDPPSPWHAAVSCSTDDLVHAYLTSCHKLNLRPIPKLLQQLQAISDFCDRNETLTLKGERMEYKQCETLEEVLRRVQFRTIDLESTHLDDEGAVALFDMVEYYESCTKLNISNNRSIGVRGWQACARMLKKTPCLENLEARSCSISDQAMPFLCRSIRLGSMLTTLHLENSVMSGRPLVILVTALKMNEIMKELFLADNRLMPSDGIQLGNLLRYNHKLLLIDIRNNHLQDVGTCHICDGLWEQNLGQGLSTLVLWNNQITYQSMSPLTRALVNTKSLETLNLGHNNITTEGIHRLKEGLLHNKSLLRIGLQAAKISCEGAVALAEFIAESPRLLRIDLRENEIKTGGLMALALSLKVSESVTRIDLDKEPKRESSMKDYAEQQKRLLNDITNYMQRNRDQARRQEEDELRRLQDQQEQEELQLEQELGQVAAIKLGQAQDETQPDTEPTDGTSPTDADEEEQLYKQADTESEMHQEGSPKRPEHLNLSSGPGAKTLESPAFIPAAALPLLTSPVLVEADESDGEERQEGSGKATDAAPDTRVTFPPSPMVSSEGRSVLAPISASGAVPSPGSPSEPRPLRSRPGLRVEVPPSGWPSGGSPCGSPTTRQRFRINRVEEPAPVHSETTKISGRAEEGGDSGGNSCSSGDRTAGEVAATADCGQDKVQASVRNLSQAFSDVPSDQVSSVVSECSDNVELDSASSIQSSHQTDRVSLLEGAEALSDHTPNCSKAVSGSEGDPSAQNHTGCSREPQKTEMDTGSSHSRQSDKAPDQTSGGEARGPDSIVSGCNADVSPSSGEIPNGGDVTVFDGCDLEGELKRKSSQKSGGEDCDSEQNKTEKDIDKSAENQTGNPGLLPSNTDMDSLRKGNQSETSIHSTNDNQHNGTATPDVNSNSPANADHTDQSNRNIVRLAGSEGDGPGQKGELAAADVIGLNSSNGLNLDISDVLENLEKVNLMGLDLGSVPAADNNEDVGSPDDFEKELDAMLASVQGLPHAD